MWGSILEIEGIQKHGESSTRLLSLASIIPQQPEPTMFGEKGKKYGLVQTTFTKYGPYAKNL